MSLSLKESLDDCMSTEYHYHIKIQDILSQNSLFKPIDIFPSTSLKDENLILFISFLKNSVYQVYKENIVHSHLINNTNYCLSNKNYIGPEREDISSKQVWDALMVSVSEHTRWTTR